MAASASQAGLYFSEGRALRIHTDSSNTFRLGHDPGTLESNVTSFLYGGSKLKMAPMFRNYK